MARKRRVLAFAVAASTLSVGMPLSLSAGAATPSYTVQTLHFDTAVGPNNQTHCDIIGDLYRPSTATKSHPAPAILTTNGFGGSKDDQAAQSIAFAKRGYVSLSYSGLGFGGSGCNIELDSPEWDGQAAKQLVDFLGGEKAATNGLKIDYVQLDKTAANGKHYLHDPRVGMIGGSYGGQVQFAAASVDPRIDTIIPIITWNDLSYSLAPNNTSFSKGVSYTTPGVEKYQWTSLFFSLGIADGIQDLGKNQSYPNGCANFDSRACGAKAEMDALGYPTPSTLAFARQASVTSYVNKIKIPTLLAQGEADTLFNLQESVATYNALRAQRTPVQLVWQSWGHSNSTPAPGELDFKDLFKSYEGQLFSNWFDYYLAGKGSKPALDFSYFRPWVSYKGIAGPAFAHAPSYPAGKVEVLHLSGNGNLTTSAKDITAGSSSFVGAPGGAPTSFSEISAVGGSVPSAIYPSPLDAPGTFAAWQSPTLAKDTDVAGIATLSAAITAQPGSAVSSAGPLSTLVVFAKLYDLAPDGTKTLTQSLISPTRIDLSKKGPVAIELPGIVHRFLKGHSLQLVLAAGDDAFRGNDLPQAATVTISRTQPATFQIPVV